MFHPALADVSLGLLHGSQPGMFIVCHGPQRTHLLGYLGTRLSSIETLIEHTIALGRSTNPAIRCVGIALNTGAMNAASAQAKLTRPPGACRTL